MALESISLETLIIVLAAVTLLVGNVTLWRRFSSLQKRFDEQDARHRKELQMLSQSQVGMGRKLVDFELKVGKQPEPTEVAKPVAAKPQTPAITGSDDAGSYNNAVNLFSQGFTPDEVARRCGLSKAEANLMALVNKEAVSHH
ncbi:DUF2802 domain-containing protein [Halioxenophilus sp. WMMB6]|uniref:DUF2802 domain-containing protein n=1 Tax=Halioxenophilus sp. WMMB6 TaxID=3073815 RepID=UPI00295EE24A|nr:DUF2802 domain-containing protein [Halioxenophilus sp. WMMB6]